ncbi:MAG TPA: D-glycero-beta-D-manno-heptose-7-phosphate kinase [Candidatus Methylacidiphilales bacterium]|jgi:D-beta-D-heptose 7-phosphate kinase/D-beta-D-heptose 1-phosphate adenosyltransferase|nr:D-glycero-beta-D-manno-heptose-7-phosphate kinase [Candidatus Methylacidiphilales bacterium]
MHFTSTRLGEILDAFPRRKILVVGDLMLDEFLWGKVTRISPEAPVPVVDIQRRAAYPGGAANVARNIASLGARAALAGVIGEDQPGEQLVRLLTGEGIATGGIRATPLRPTTHKTRVCAITRQLHDHLEIEDQQQIVRVDDESRAPLDPESKRRLFDRLREEISAHDAVIIEDYAKGLVDQELVELVVAEAKAHGKIVAIDPNPNNPFDWSGGTVLKPNRREAFLAAGLPYSPDEKAVLAAGAVLQKKHAIRYVLITLGEAGMLLLEQGQKPYHTPTRAQEVFDVSGAGDTAIAAFTLALAAGATGIEAAEIANHAAGVVVGKLGTATLDVAELREIFVKTEGVT